MDHHVTRRILHGLGANAYGQLVVIVIQLAGVPILLHAWGTQLYGEWLILAAIPTYLSMADLGFSQSAANDMTAQVARGDRAEALAVFQSLGALVFSAASIGLLLVTMLLFGLPLQHWLHFQAMSTGEVRWVLWFLAAEMLVRLTEGTVHAGFRANGDYALHTAIYYSTMLVQYAGAWYMAEAGMGPIRAAASFFVVRCIVTPAAATWLIRRHAWLHFGFKKAKTSELRRLGRPALANLGMPLAQALNVQGMVLAVGAVLGPLAVVTFSTLRTLTRLVMQLGAAVSNAAEPEFASAHGKVSLELLQKLYAHVLRASFWLALPAAIGLALLGSDILHLWTHGRVAMNALLFRWLLISALANVFWYGALIVLKAANRHLRTAFLYSLSAGASVLVAVGLLIWSGRLADAGLALLIMDAAMAAYTLRAACRLIDIPAWQALGRALDPRPLLHLKIGSVHVA